MNRIFIQSQVRPMVPHKLSRSFAKSAFQLPAPHEWYASARAVKRRVIFHCGPTNSGKTYSALEALRKSPSGIYCGPLRLMASEVSERLNGLGLPTNLLTGQEVVSIPKARHIACTVEMAPLSEAVHCAVVDEAQLLGDSQRGWAFTRAFLGLPAAELHVCGSPSLLPLCLRLAEACGDDVETREYDRLAPLEVGGTGRDAPRFVDGRWRGLRRGDCLIAFSRRRLFELKREIDSTTKHRASIIYGGLPPDARREQARLFNQSQGADEAKLVKEVEEEFDEGLPVVHIPEANDYSVLVASDAVGMGLNLSIGRVIFTSLHKFDGEQQRTLTTAEAKQVAGRAGRFGSPHPIGYATATSKRDLSILKTLLGTQDLPQQRAGLFPTLDQLKRFHHQQQQQQQQEKQRRIRRQRGHGRDELVLSELFEAFEAAAQVESRDYFMCDLEDAAAAAALIDHVNLSLKDRYTHCLAPLNPDDPVQASWFVHYATQLARVHAHAFQEEEEYDNDDKDDEEYDDGDEADDDRGYSEFDGSERGETQDGEVVSSSRPASRYFVALGFHDAPPPGEAVQLRVPRTPKHVASLESKHAVVDLWLWLAQRFPHAYRDDDVTKARELQAHLSHMVEKGLQAITVRDNEGVKQAARNVGELVDASQARRKGATDSWHEERKGARREHRSGSRGKLLRKKRR